MSGIPLSPLLNLLKIFLGQTILSLLWISQVLPTRVEASFTYKMIAGAVAIDLAFLG